MGWMLRPIDRGYCKFESLLDGTLDLSHVALMNDYIDVRDENQWRAHEASKPKK